MDRIPLSGLGVGHQEGKGPSGKAIVVVSPTIDKTKPVDVLLHFHGHNVGHAETGKTVRDDAVDNIEGQMASSGRPQLVGILPQGTPGSEFGITPTKGDPKNKSFDPDAYIDTIFSVLVNLGVWKTKPSVTGVMISGHSGAGEVINEKILGSALGSKIGKNATDVTGSKVPAKFKELALFDAVNGPKEHARLSEFLNMKMADELKNVLAISGTDDRVNYLKTSFKFRAYFSHDSATGTFYSQWHVGPVTDKNAIYKEPIDEVIKNFLAANAAALGGNSSAVFQAFAANYRVIDSGAVPHPTMVKANNNLKDAISVLPKRADGLASHDPALIPPAVHQTLGTSGRSLDQTSLAWANQHFQRDMSRVRIHDDDRAAASARSVGAIAYTAGRDIVFDRGHFAPTTESGRRLLAHELTHVIQQGERPASAADLSVGPRGDALETQADRVADPVTGPGAARSLASGVASSRLQRAPTVNAAMCEANKNKNPAELGTCNYKEPENCPTYESWIATFTLLKTFEAKDTPGTAATEFDVFGAEAAKQDFRPTPKGQVEPGAAPTPGKAFPRLKPGERFIDHPTDKWVQECLPENLRATAYRLPADCADIAMILRHVWLSAHHRTQKFFGWTLGSAAGKAEEKDIQAMITAEGTQRVSGIVAPYTDANNKPLLSIKALAPLLHAGDILVWWHYDKGFDKPHTGGHTHTISQVIRDDAGNLKDLILLQGNEPLFEPQKTEITEFLKKESPKATPPTFEKLGVAPGRRIEKSVASSKKTGLKFVDQPAATKKGTEPPVPTWIWGTDTLLIAAGPPKAAARPPMQAAKKGEKQVKRLSDWYPSFKKATRANMFDFFEAALFEARAMIEGGEAVTDDDFKGLGEAAGQMVWRLAKAANDLGEESHFRVINEMRAILDLMKSSSTQPVATGSDPKSSRSRLNSLFKLIDESFHFAARGGSDISFSAPRVKPEKLVKTMLTGFDPFNTDDAFNAPPRAGEWNPSGAAVMAMDGKTIDLEKGGKAAVEGVVLPVNYKDFSAGLVEKMIQPHLSSVDAVLTVSVDPSIPSAGAVIFEQYAVGAHIMKPGDAAKPSSGKLKPNFVIEPVAAAPGGKVGKEIIKSDAPLQDIAKATEKAETKRTPGVPKPEIREVVSFVFATAGEADSALKALGLKTQGKMEVTISNAAALKQISSSMTRDDSAGALTTKSNIRLDGPAIKFKAGGKEFKAFVTSGPGGNFLSNEVSYRVLRMIGEMKSSNPPISFHTHTEKGNLIPQDTSTKEATKAKKDAIKEGLKIRDRLVRTLTRMIQAVGNIILGKRAPASSSTGGKTK
jgi:hypothetical protein